MWLLAQSQDVNESVEQGINWLTQDPTGRIVGIAIGAVVLVFVLLIFFKMFKWAAARWKMFTGVAILIAGVVYGLTYVMQMGIAGFVIMAAIGFGAFLGFALYATQGGMRR